MIIFNYPLFNSDCFCYNADILCDHGMNAKKSEINKTRLLFVSSIYQKEAIDMTDREFKTVYGRLITAHGLSPGASRKVLQNILKTIKRERGNKK